VKVEKVWHIAGLLQALYASDFIWDVLQNRYDFVYDSLHPLLALGKNHGVIRKRNVLKLSLVRRVFLGEIQHLLAVDWKLKFVDPAFQLKFCHLFFCSHLSICVSIYWLRGFSSSGGFQDLVLIIRVVHLLQIREMNEYNLSAHYEFFLSQTSLTKINFLYLFQSKIFTIKKFEECSNLRMRQSRRVNFRNIMVVF